MKDHSQRGQSTIEFIFAFAFGLSLILVIFNSALNHTTGYLVHYATFMASRTFLTFDDALYSPDAHLPKAREAATATFEKYMLQIFNVPSSNFFINEKGLTANEYLTVGAYTKFEQRIDMIGKIMGQSQLELVSESFLGQEPTRAHCAERVCYAITGATSCDGLDVSLYDNGC